MKIQYISLASLLISFAVVGLLDIVNPSLFLADVAGNQGSNSSNTTRSTTGVCPKPLMTNSNVPRNYSSTISAADATAGLQREINTCLGLAEHTCTNNTGSGFVFTPIESKRSPSGLITTAKQGAYWVARTNGITWNCNNPFTGTKTQSSAGQGSITIDPIGFPGRPWTYMDSTGNCVGAGTYWNGSGGGNLVNQAAQNAALANAKELANSCVTYARGLCGERSTLADKISTIRGGRILVSNAPNGGPMCTDSVPTGQGTNTMYRATTTCSWRCMQRIT